MDESTVKYGVHWWRFSTPVRDLGEVMSSIAGVSGGEFTDPEEVGAFNQPRRIRHVSGAAVYFGSRMKGQPIVVDVRGEACEVLPVQELCDWALNLRGRPSRLDVAADIEPKSAARSRLIEMHDMFRRGRCETRMPCTSCDLVQSDRPGGGWTAYFGSRQSPLFTRAYDQRGPLRVEHELKPKDRSVREQLPERLARYGAGGIWRRLAKSCVWPMSWYRELLAGEAAEIEGAPGQVKDLSEYIEQLIAQHGVNFWGLDQLGLTLADLVRTPEKLWAEQQQRFNRWVKQAPQLGYDPSKLKREVKRCRRSK